MYVSPPLSRRFSPLFKDVYREVGILEVLVQCLARYADLLKSRRQTEEDGDGKQQDRAYRSEGGGVR